MVMGYGCTGLEYTHRRLMPNESQLVADQRQRAGMNILIDRLDARRGFTAELDVLEAWPLDGPRMLSMQKITLLPLMYTIQL